MVDTIALHVENMKRLSHAGEYEEANYILERIKKEIQKSDNDTGFSLDVIERVLKGTQEPITIKETYNIIIGHSIRLSPDLYPFNKLLALVIDVHKRVSKIRNPYLCSNTDKVRRIVAEEMNKHQMTIKTSSSNVPREMKPNRAFLDIAMKVNPSICKGEVERREKVKLWKAIESGSSEKIETARKGLRDVRNAE